MKKIIAQNSILNFFKTPINFSKESIIFNMSFLLICNAPNFWQLRLQDLASSIMEEILLFNKHLLSPQDDSPEHSGTLVLSNVPKKNIHVS